MFELLGNVGGLMESARLTAEEDAFMESFDGYDCPYDDADEATLYAAMESQQNFNNLMQAVALQEMNYYMTHGEEMVYEAVDFKGFFGKIKAIILKAWEKIKGIFKKIFGTIDGWVRSDSGYIKKYEKDMKNADGVTIDFKGYPVNLAFTTDIYKELANGSSEITKEFEKNSKEVNNTQRMVKDESKFHEKLIKSISNNKAKTKDEYINWVKEGLKIKDKMTINKYDAGLCIDEIKNAKIAKKIAKDSYDACKSFWNLLARQCDIAADTAIAELHDSKSDTSEKEKKINAAAGTFTKGCNMVNSLGQSALNVNIKAIKIAHDQAKAMTVKALAKKKDNDKDKKKSSNESFTGYMDFDLI